MKFLQGNLVPAGILHLIFFAGIFFLLQHDSVYRKTLGQFSSNYKRSELNGHLEINRIKSPYEQLSENKFRNWDADIYYCISQDWYKKEDGCYSQVKGAFFPLFPLLWKISGLSPIGISVLNYFLFILSIGLLVTNLIIGSRTFKLLIFLLFITLPSTIIFYIPYSEALFLFTMTLAVLAHRKNNYPLFFLAFMAMAMVRPATLFICLAILIIELIRFMNHKKPVLFLRQTIKNTLPLILGYALVFIIQAVSTGSLTAMTDAQKYWQASIGVFNKISDWSVEGFGLNSFSVIFIGFVSLFTFIAILLKNNSYQLFFSGNDDDEQNSERYFILVSLLYMAGIFVYIFFTSAGSLHSFFRFTMCSPPFYLLMISLVNAHSRIKKTLLLVLPVLVLILFILFLRFSGFGPEHPDFSYAGLYLALCSSFFLYYVDLIPKPVQWVLLIFILACSVIWNTYMLNIFLCEGWIFT